mmetsp:Transcript_34576/g.58078  ORF Transcript_34576/g.58078 Transcript_34576/m.58078 type:complete len:517 (-) Transcript_34576:133-1683(-)
MRPSVARTVSRVAWVIIGCLIGFLFSAFAIWKYPSYIMATVGPAFTVQQVEPHHTPSPDRSHDRSPNNLKHGRGRLTRSDWGGGRGVRLGDGLDVDKRLLAPRNYSEGRYPSVETWPALRRIWKHQNPPECGSSRFIVWPYPNPASTRNIGSIFTTLMRWLPMTMVKNRILIVDDRNWSLADCPSKNSECYFEPVTNCSIADLDPLKGSDQYHIIKHLGENLDKIEHVRVWQVPGTWWMEVPIKEADLQETLFWPGKSRQHGCRTWSASLNYLMRPKPWVQEAMDARLVGTFPADFDPSKAVGLPIRASDKCFQHKVGHSANGEKECLPLETYMDIADSIREYDPEVKFLLLSSEDENVVKRIVAMNAERGSTVDQSMVDQSTSGMVGFPPLHFKLAAAANATHKGNNSKKPWMIVTNKGDTTSGSGSATYFVEQAKQGKVFLSTQMVSALSSLHFQLRSRYLIVEWASSFLLMIHLMHLEDRGTHTSARMQIDTTTLRDFHWKPYKGNSLQRWQC